MNKEIVRRTIAAFAWARANNNQPTKITQSKPESGRTVYFSDSNLSEGTLRYFDSDASAICFGNINPASFYIDVASYSSGAYLRMSGNYGSATDRIHNKEYSAVEVSGNKVLIRFSDLEEYLYEVY